LTEKKKREIASTLANTAGLADTCPEPLNQAVPQVVTSKDAAALATVVNPQQVCVSQ
jgi:hypothetical protein